MPLTVRGISAIINKSRSQRFMPFASRIAMHDESQGMKWAISIKENMRSLTDTITFRTGFTY